MAYTTINKSSDYFNTKLYTGDGGTQSVTGVGFQPDWTWIKNRGSTDSHNVYDAVRGVTKYLLTNNSVAEGTTSGVTAFNSDGFSVGNNSMTNSNSNNYASWNWKAGTAVSGSTTGSGTAKTYTGSVNTTAGFSIIKYVGNGSAGHTIPHHLGTANIGSIFVKNLDSGSDYWYSYHKPLGATKTLILNETDGVGTNTMWNNAAPTSSVFSVGASSGSNSNNDNYIAYIFSDVQGYCKTGKYTGNGSSTDGTFIYTGFKPAFVITKSTTVEAWQMTDSVRDKNVSPNFARLVPNLDSAENTNTTWAKVEKFSNGFKIGGNDSISNENGTEYIYITFGQSLVGSNNTPATAR
jgi:hypothetical protein